MQVTLSNAKQGRFGIVGHAGAGHSNSHLGFIQDDSGGLTAVMAILSRVTDVDLTITKVEVKTGKHGCFTVHTAAGGVGTGYPRRGITPYEADLAQIAVGHKAICSQTISMMCFGRTLGQGAMEVPVALQTAVANAALDSFQRHYPEHFLTGEEGLEGNDGRLLGCVIDVDGVPVALMGLLNSTVGGIGPNEDIEGNVNLAGKAEMMAALGLDHVPTVVLEGKVCALPVSPVIHEPTFVTRAFKGDDNSIVSECLEAAAHKFGYPIVYPRELLARKKDGMRNLTREMGHYVAKLGLQLAEAKTSREKVELAAELNRFCSEDLGGVTFMSDDIHEVMGGVGQIPGLTGCLSLFISNEELEDVVYPALTEEDANKYADVALGAIAELVAREQEALAEVEACRVRATEHGLVAK